MRPREKSTEMSYALERLRADGIRSKQTSGFQIKVGPYNFYPGKGTIFMDRDAEAHPERPPLQSASLIVGFGLLVQGYSVWKLRRTLDWRRLWPFVAGAALGVPAPAALA